MTGKTEVNIRMVVVVVVIIEEDAMVAVVDQETIINNDLEGQIQAIHARGIKVIHENVV
eukprot:CAMPEP_0197836338 /NCGR_PEP_ID=MMETSP1437-20131217/28614_1 /TAXON_ID=49252 ORGANISM="Eucampia antarctica, Strain CCMP1452" /NCGR_SAMPLE_ID=MMETSP1437 /ASSEMBLY_ACC=CAM_ASM_001096 /LENGTH=58 /DNA_ID=CAMNT_0043442431 /DNA_START=110 /DNA_END=286 /DNA_ORIENTATION=-